MARETTRKVWETPSFRIGGGGGNVQLKVEWEGFVLSACSWRWAGGTLSISEGY